jgi:AraC-binding-like domain
LQDIAVGFGGTTRRAIVKFDETEFARLQFAMRGKARNEVGGQEVALRAGQPCVTSPYRAAILDYGGDFEEIVLRVGADALNRELAQMTGIAIGRKIEFERQQFTSQLAISGMENLLQLFMQSIDDETALISPVARRELEQAIVVQFLFACRHNFSPLLERDASDVAPSQVRLTAEYIDAQANHDRCAGGGERCQRARLVQEFCQGLWLLSDAIREAAASRKSTPSPDSCRHEAVRHGGRVCVRLSEPRALCPRLSQSVRRVSVANAVAQNHPGIEREALRGRARRGPIEK